MADRETEFTQQNTSFTIDSSNLYYLPVKVNAAKINAELVSASSRSENSEMMQSTVKFNLTDLSFYTDKSQTGVPFLNPWEQQRNDSGENVIINTLNEIDLDLNEYNDISYNEFGSTTYLSQHK